MTNYSFGDTVLVPFPFTDQSSIKKRPAVIVSSSAYNEKRQDIIIMAVTSQVHSLKKFGDVFVKEWENAGFLKPSIIKAVFTTIEKGLVLRKLGRISKDDRISLQKSLQEIIGEK